MAEEMKQKEPSVSSIYKRDWREKYRTSTEQYYYMYCKGIATDCTLVVDNDGKKEEIQVHRLQLARASRQFHFLIAKNEMLDSQRPLRIVLNNFSPHTIRLMLRCIYEDKVEFETFDDAFNSILAAHLYEIKPLLDIGASALIKYLTPEKVFIVWRVTQTITLPDVTQSCIEALKLDTLQCISGPHFVAEVTEDFVVLLLEQDELSVKDELVLVNATVSWARHEAKKRGLSGDDAGVRTVIEPRILGLLRLLTIPLDMFITGPGLSGWLTVEEKNQIIAHIESRDKDELPNHLCNLRTMRIKTVVNENVGQRRNNVCKRHVITKQPNLQLSLNTECNICADPNRNPAPVITQGKCLHAQGVFRVKSSCRLVGFECLSREFKTEDPTFIYKRSRTSYKECIDVVLVRYGLSLASEDTTSNPRFKALCSMQFNEDSHYDSIIKIKFQQPIELKTNSWYGLRIKFSSADVNDNVEYPHFTRPAKGTSTSGVEFRFQTKEMPGYINSTNDGVIKTLILS